MGNEYKQCSNGHYYQGDHCPYCKSGIGHGGTASAGKTEVYGNQGADETEVYGGNQRTTVAGVGIGQRTVSSDGNQPRPMSENQPRIVNTPPMSGCTVFGDDDETEVVSTPSGTKVQRVNRETRKLVGWLVSYTLDPLGVDFKLYEGRNVIGRDIDCAITVNDNRVSAKHAVLLFRSGKYSITDSQSSHGTYVNNQDIDLEPCYLNDGDVIQMGDTVFKFRSAL